MEVWLKNQKFSSKNKISNIWLQEDHDGRVEVRPDSQKVVQVGRLRVFRRHRRDADDVGVVVGQEKVVVVAFCHEQLTVGQLESGSFDMK